MDSRKAQENTHKSINKTQGQPKATGNTCVYLQPVELRSPKEQQLRKQLKVISV